MENQENEKQLIEIPGIGEVEQVELDNILAALKKIFTILEQQDKHDHSNKKGTGVPVSFKNLEDKPVANDYSHDELKNVSNQGKHGHVKDGDTHDHSEKSGGSPIDHNDLKNKGKNSHESIDKHIASKDNPHKVTAKQIGALPTDGGRIDAEGRPALELNRVDIGTILALLSDGKSVVEVSDKEVTLKAQLKGKLAQFDDLKIKKINGTDLEKLLKIEKPLHKDLSDAGKNTHKQIDQHIDKKGNPHGTTASDIGALPLEGGKIVGGLEIQLKDKKVFAILSKDGEQIMLVQDGQVVLDSLKTRELTVEKLNTKISHDQLEGKGKYTHEDIDKHLSEKNPHDLKLEDLLSDGAIEGKHIKKHSLNKAHLDPDFVQELLPQVKKEDIDGLTKYIDLRLNELDGSLETDLAELEAKVIESLNGLVQSAAAEPVIQPLSTPAQVINPLPDGVGFKLDKRILFIEGIKGLAFKVGEDIVAITNDGLLINGAKWVNKEEKTIVQQTNINANEIINEIAASFNENLQREINALKNKSEQDLISAKDEIRDIISEKIAKAIELIPAKPAEQRSTREPVTAVNDIINLPGARIEDGKLIFEYEVIKFLASQIEFNETAKIELDGDIFSEGRVCGVDLNEIQKDGSIDHTKLKNAGKVSHSDLDKHVNLKTNPHETRMIQSKDGEDALKRIAALEAELAELKEILKNMQK